MDLLSRLRALAATAADYDGLSDAEHAAVLDAGELLDALRPRGYGFAVTEAGVLKVRPPRPAGTAAPGAVEHARRRVAGLASAIVYVLRVEASTTPLPDACRACGAPVWQYSPNGHPYCEPHYRLAERRSRERDEAGPSPAGQIVALAEVRRRRRALAAQTVGDRSDSEHEGRSRA
jgi:hypothetical protein